MAEHSTTAAPHSMAEVETLDAFLADRQRFWAAFTHFTLGCAICIAVLLILMAVFLL